MPPKRKILQKQPSSGGMIVSNVSPPNQLSSSTNDDNVFVAKTTKSSVLKKTEPETTITKKISDKKKHHNNEKNIKEETGPDDTFFEIPREIIKSPFVISLFSEEDENSKKLLLRDKKLSKTNKTQSNSTTTTTTTKKHSKTRTSLKMKSSSPLGCCSSSSPTSRSVSSLEGNMASLMLSSLEDNYKNIQRLHLVIDLDATFVSTSTDDWVYNKVVKILSSTATGLDILRRRVYLFTVGKYKMCTILRPGALEFIEFASFYFKRISVWSAGQKDYVDQIVSFLFPAHIPRPSLVFNWDDCSQEVVSTTTSGRSHKKSSSNAKAASPSNQEYVTFTKPLVEMIAHGPKGEGLENMIILDDRKDIAEKNIENLVQIPPYEPNINYSELTAQDNCLDLFVEWLMSPEVMSEKDIRKVEKTKIFRDALII